MAELYVGLENNQKILIPTSSEARSGNPLGTILALQSNVVPYGYLPCNGVAFDEQQYPALYALLGDNHTPYSYDKSRLGDWESITLNPSGTTMPYDGFIKFMCNSGSNTLMSFYINGVQEAGIAYESATNRQFIFPVNKGDVITYSVSNTTIYDTRACFYTHFNVIKATSGLEETQQDYVLQSLLEADSYSTEEVATGKKWIDGKPIYRKVIQGNFANGTILMSNIAMMTSCYGLTGGDMLPKEGSGFFYKVRLNATAHTIYIDASATVDYIIVVEYTKTTD